MNESTKPDKELQWDGDVFDRKQYADFLTNFLLTEKENFVLNLDASWGTGKSFFLNHWHNDLINGKHASILFNAWETDYSDDPFVALASCINDALIKMSPKDALKSRKKKLYEITGNILRTTAPSLLKGLAKHYIGKDGVKALEDIGEDDEDAFADAVEAYAKSAIGHHKKAAKSIEDFKVLIGEAICEINKAQEYTAPLFIFIDELDRCRPTYAIELLENIKHIFDIKSVFFIVATDTSQLSNSVKAIYGQGFSSEKYLRRFFHRTYTLPEPDSLQFAQFLSKKFEYQEIGSDIIKLSNMNTVLDEVSLLFASFSNAFDLTLRDQEQCFGRLDAIIRTFPKGEKIHIALLMFLTIFHHVYGNEEYYSSIIHGNALSNKKYKPTKYGITCGTEETDALSIAAIYLEVHRYDLRKIINTTNSSSGYTARQQIGISIIDSCNQKNILKKYPDLILLAGSLH